MSISEVEQTRTLSWQHYTFRYRDKSGNIVTREVYAGNDHAAAIRFNEMYGHDVKEMISIGR